MAEIGTKFLMVRDSTLRFFVGDRKKLLVPSIPGGGTGRATAAGVNNEGRGGGEGKWQRGIRNGPATEGLHPRCT